MNILITGSNSGLGKYLHKNLGGMGFDRNTSSEERERIKKEGADVIIHCAFNSSKEINSDSLYDYIEDNILLAKELVKLPQKKFIFISTIDVYPKDGKVHSEDEAIDVNSVEGLYATTKLVSESIVKRQCPNYLILRCGALLGKDSRKNSLIKIIEDKECVLTLSGNSKFNYVLHSDILEFIKFSIKKDIRGLYNAVSSESITLSEVAKIIRKKVSFGNYLYDAGEILNEKITSLVPSFKKTSKETISQFLKQWNN